MGKHPSIVLGLYSGSYNCNWHTPNVLSLAWTLFESESYGGYLWATSCRVDSNRNYLINDFLTKTTGDYLFIIDEDMIHPPQMPVLLADRDLPIVSGLYFKRDEHGLHFPQFYKFVKEAPDERRGHGTAVNNLYRVMADEVTKVFMEWGDVPKTNGPLVVSDKDGVPVTDGLLEIDGGGFGCLMMRRDVLEALEPPYLITEPGLNGDLVFYKRAKAAGFKIYGDCRVIAAHMQMTPIGAAAFTDVSWNFVQGRLDV